MVYCAVLVIIRTAKAQINAMLIDQILQHNSNNFCLSKILYCAKGEFRYQIERVI